MFPLRYPSTTGRIVLEGQLLMRRVGLRPPAAQPRHLQPAPARLRADLAVGVPGQIDFRVGISRGRRRPERKARLWPQLGESGRADQEAVGLRLQPDLQRHAEQRESDDVPRGDERR
jgi:hypothetical protein